MRFKKPRVFAGKLHLPGREPISFPSDEAYRVLKELKSFQYEMPSTFRLARFSCRKDKVGGISYWYAYKKINGRLHKKYIGTTEKLSNELLLRVGVELKHTTPIGEKKINDELRREDEKSRPTREGNGEEIHSSLCTSKLDDIRACCEKWKKEREAYSSKSRDWTFGDRILSDLSDALDGTNESSE